MPTRDEAWKARFDQLVKYRQKYGHTKVSRADDEALYIWCYTQRRKRRNSNASLAKDRMEKLNSIGFWDEEHRTPGRRSKSNTSKSAISKQKKREGPKKRSGDVMMRDASPKVAKKRSSLKTNDAKSQAALAAAVILTEEEQEEAASAIRAGMPVQEEDVVVAPAKATEEVKPNESFLSKSFDTVKWFATGIKHLVSF